MWRDDLQLMTMTPEDRAEFRNDVKFMRRELTRIAGALSDACETERRALDREWWSVMDEIKRLCAALSVGVIVRTPEGIQTWED